MHIWIPQCSLQFGELWEVLPLDSCELRSNQSWDCSSMLEVPADQLLMGSAKLKFSLLFELLDYSQRDLSSVRI